jgi:hypothetical protein
MRQFETISLRLGRRRRRCCDLDVERANSVEFAVSQHSYFDGSVHLDYERREADIVFQMNIWRFGGIRREFRRHFYRNFLD